LAQALSVKVFRKNTFEALRQFDSETAKIQIAIGLCEMTFGDLYCEKSATANSARTRQNHITDQTFEFANFTL